MTDPLSLGLAAGTLGIALAAGWAWMPRPPPLDGERWFKLTLATLLRGETEASGGDAARWHEALRRHVPYHPAGRMPERKVANPIAARLPGAALPGELALLDALAQLADADARWRHLYDLDPVGLAARSADPTDLGPDYALASWLALAPRPDETGWDVVAAWARGDPRPASALQGTGLRWILWEGPERVGAPRVLPALADATGGERWPWPVSPAEETARAARLEAVAGALGGRCVLVAEDRAMIGLLAALAASPALRDVTAAVVSVGGAIGGEADAPAPFDDHTRSDWLGAHFTHDALDTERVRRTPYVSVQWLDRSAPVPGVGALPLGAQRFPEPAVGSGPALVEVVDLGPLPAASDLPVVAVARALALVVSAWVASRQ